MESSTTTTTVLSSVRQVNVNLLLIAVSIVMMTSASPMDVLDNPCMGANDGSADITSMQSIPTDIKCILIAPEGSENGLIRRKRSTTDDKFKFNMFGLSNVDLMTSTLAKKPRQENQEAAPEQMKLWKLMARHGR